MPRWPGLIWADSSQVTLAAIRSWSRSGSAAAKTMVCKRDRVGAAQIVGAEAAKMIQRLANGRRIGFLAGGQEGQRDQAGRSRLGLRD